MYYQVRDLYNGRMLLQTDKKYEVWKFLESRNPDFYQVYGMENPEGSVRWVENGRNWLNSMTADANTQS